jgi:diacylglycerol kinase family enzyme
LEINRDCTALAETIAAGRIAWLDAGRANGRIFLLESSIGYPAEVVRQLHAERAGHITHWTYARPILNTIRGYGFPSMRAYCSRAAAGEPSQPNWSDPIECCWAFVFNAPRYGGGFKIAPAADPSDGQLDLCTFRRGGLIAGLRYLAAVKQGRHERLEDFKSCRAARVRIESDDLVPYELDGDPGGMLPLEIEVVPKRVCLLVPSQWPLAARHG